MTEGNAKLVPLFQSDANVLLIRDDLCVVW